MRPIVICIKIVNEVINIKHIFMVLAVSLVSSVFAGTARADTLCVTDGYWGGYSALVRQTDKEGPLSIEVERYKGPDGDGEASGPYVLSAKKVKRECDVFEFDSGYLKVCNKTGELSSTLPGMGKEVVSLTCR